jgi:biofilm PGA synthesis N-glycosyltransferase PgaC
VIAYTAERTDTQPDWAAPAALQCSVGVMAYNEAANIRNCLVSILGQRLRCAQVDEILVVVSGSTDNTAAIVEEIGQQDSRVQLLLQAGREGKASAVNLFLRRSRSPIFVIVGADTILPPDSLEHLIFPFRDPEVGMTGGHPIPVNDQRCFTGFAAHLLWDLHHYVALKTPKLGELTAVRRIFERIPQYTAVDEANMEPLVRGQGYEIRYVPEATVSNRGPATIGDFLKQRRRIYAGHCKLRRIQGYRVSTMSGVRILLTLAQHPEWHWRWWLWTPGVIGLEVLGRFLGWWDFRWANRSHTIWDVAVSTKQVN